MKKTIKLRQFTLGAATILAVTFSSPLPSLADPPKPALSQAQIKAIVDGLIGQGLVYYSKNEFAKAAEAFGQAYAMKPLPAIGYNRIKSLEKLGKLLEAEQAAKELRSHPTPTDPEQVTPYENTQKLLTELTARIPTVTVTIAGASAGKKVELKLDGSVSPIDQPQRVNPGTHKVTAKAEGVFPAERSVTVKDREVFRLEMAMQPASSTSSLRTIGFITGAAGLAGIGVGSVLGVLAIQKNNDSNDGPCVKDACTQDGIDLRADSIAMGNGSTAAFVIGGVALAAGVTMVLVASKQPNTPSARVGMGPRGLLLSGEW